MAGVNSPSGRDIALDRDALWSVLFPGSVPPPVLPGIAVPGINAIRGSQVIAYAATITPDPTQGEFILVGTLTAGITVAAPVRQDGAPIVTGQMIAFVFVQDGTGGRAITWNAVFQTTWQPGKLASAVSSITFEYDGTHFIPVAGQFAVDQTGNASVQGGLTFGGTTSLGSPFLGGPSTSTLVAGGVAVADWTSNKRINLRGSLSRPAQTPTEAVLVSGVAPNSGEIISVTLTAARVVGVPTPVVTGERIQFVFIQGGAGGWAVTWNAVFKVSWSDTGNTTGKRTTIAFMYDGTNWNQDGAQTPYV